MKVRLGYVSNSSSSSFILQLSGRPTSVEDMGRMLFGDNIPVMIASYGGSVPSLTIIERVYKDINEHLDTIGHTSLDWTGLEDEIYFYYKRDIIKHRKMVIPKYYAEYDKITDKMESVFLLIDEVGRYTTEGRVHSNKIDSYSKEIYPIIRKSILESSSDTDIFISMDYADGDGNLDSIIEHNGVLSNITLQQFSKH